MADANNPYGDLDAEPQWTQPEDGIAASNALLGKKNPSPSQLSFGGGGVPPEGPSASNPLTSRTLLNAARNPGIMTSQGAPQGGLSNVAPGVDVEHLQPEFASRLQKLQSLAQARGIETKVTSGYRDPQLQAKLYANHLASQAGQPLPYPDQPAPAVVAKPGQSMHNFGLAADVYSVDPKRQEEFDSLASQVGLISGSQFGDSGHFQLGGAKPSQLAGGGAAGPSPQGTSYVPPPNGGQIAEPANNLANSEPQAGSAPAARTSLGGLYTLQMIQQLFPQHQFTPVDYNPYALLPKVQS